MAYCASLSPMRPAATSAALNPLKRSNGVLVSGLRPGRCRTSAVRYGREVAKIAYAFSEGAEDLLVLESLVLPDWPRAVVAVGHRVEQRPCEAVVPVPAEPSPEGAVRREHELRERGAARAILADRRRMTEDLGGFT